MMVMKIVVLVQYTYTVAWNREDGSPLPDRAMDDAQGVLKITNLQPHDGGTYICTASNAYNTASDKAMLEVSEGKINSAEKR